MDFEKNKLVFLLTYEMQKQIRNSTLYKHFDKKNIEIFFYFLEKAKIFEKNIDLKKENEISHTNLKNRNLRERFHGGMYGIGSQFLGGMYRTGSGLNLNFQNGGLRMPLHPLTYLTKLKGNYRNTHSYSGLGLWSPDRGVLGDIALNFFFCSVVCSVAASIFHCFQLRFFITEKPST